MYTQTILRSFFTKYLFWLAGLFIFYPTAKSQTIGDLIDRVHSDSLIRSVRDLSGEDSVMINGTKTRIETRQYNSTGKSIAKDYIKQRLQEYDVIVTDHPLDSIEDVPWWPCTAWSPIVNVIANQPGIKYPDSVIIICAHYDAASSYCADDNASGVAAVIEAARIFSELNFDYSIRYAFFDLEEGGLWGSRCYAKMAAMKNEKIMGVLNLDMIGYDGDNDRLCEIKTEPQNSLALTSELIKTTDVYDISLVPRVIFPDEWGSDHTSFWGEGFGAVGLSEDYSDDDFNPFYHSEQDRISEFNIPYFYEMAKLATGTIASMASKGISSPTGLTMKSSRCLTTSDTLVLATNFDAIVYIVTDTTHAVLDSIVSHQIVSDSVSASSDYKMSLTDFDYGGYMLLAVSSKDQLIKECSFFTVGQDSKEISLRVMDFQSGDPVHDCNIYYEEDELGITNKYGEIYLSNIYYGCQTSLPLRFDLSLSAQYYLPVETTIEVSSDTTVEIFLQKEFPFNICSIKVLDRANGEPVSGAVIFFNDNSKLSDYEGMVVVNLLEDKLDYKVEHANYFTLEGSVILTTSDTIVINLTRKLADVGFKVNDGEGPVSDAFVTMTDTSSSTNKDGIVWFQRPARQVHQYTVEKKDYFSMTDSLFLEIDTIVQITLDLVSIEGIIVSGIRIYPNPAQNQIILKAKEKVVYTIKITSMNGQIMHDSLILGSSQIIDISSFKKGVYFITIRSKDFVTTKKMIKL